MSMLAAHEDRAFAYGARKCCDVGVDDRGRRARRAHRPERRRQDDAGLLPRRRSPRRTPVACSSTATPLAERTRRARARDRIRAAGLRAWSSRSRRSRSSLMGRAPYPDRARLRGPRSDLALAHAALARLDLAGVDGPAPRCALRRRAPAGVPGARARAGAARPPASTSRPRTSISATRPAILEVVRERVRAPGLTRARRAARPQPRGRRVRPPACCSSTGASRRWAPTNGSDAGHDRVGLRRARPRRMARASPSVPAILPAKS